MIEIKITKKNSAIPTAWYNSQVGKTLQAEKKIKRPIHGYLVKSGTTKLIVPAEFVEEIKPLKARPKAQTRKRKVSDRQIILCVNQGMTQKQIAERYSVTPAAIQQRCAMLGIKPKKSDRVKKLVSITSDTNKRIKLIAANLDIPMGEVVDQAVEKLALEVANKIKNKEIIKQCKKSKTSSIPPK